MYVTAFAFNCNKNCNKHVKIHFYLVLTTVDSWIFIRSQYSLILWINLDHEFKFSTTQISYWLVCRLCQNLEVKYQHTCVFSVIYKNKWSQIFSGRTSINLSILRTDFEICFSRWLMQFSCVLQFFNILFSLNLNYPLYFHPNR